MNAAILTRLARLVTEAAHPERDVYGIPYTPDERADWRHAQVNVDRWWIDETRYGGDGVERLSFKLTPQGACEPEIVLDIDHDGNLTQSGHVRIPPEDCDCECPGGGPAGSKVDRSDCPRHGDSWRELEAQLKVTSIGWEIVDRPHPLRNVTRRESARAGDRVGGIDVPVSAATYSTWKFVVRTGDPTHDVLAKYRAERAAAKA